MDHTTVETRVQVAQKLRRLTDVVAELEEAGVPIIVAEATISRQDNILVSAHERGSIRVLLDWLRAAGIGTEITFNSYEEAGLRWEFCAERNGVMLNGYLTDEEAELWRELEAAE